MDSLNRIFNSINEAKKVKNKKKGMVGPTPKGSANRYDSGSFGMKAESSHLSPKQEKIAKVAGDPTKIDAADLAALRSGKKKKVNASTEIIQVLDLLKEAYQDELISEEAFLAIADPIMRSLMEGRSVTFPDTFEMEDLDDAEKEKAEEAEEAKPDGPEKVNKGNKPSSPNNPAQARRSFSNRAGRSRRRDRG